MSTWQDAVSRITHRLTLVVGRGRSVIGTEAGKIQKHQVTINSLETPDLRLVQHFGFQSFPPAGTDFILVFPTGDRSNGAIIASHNLSLRFKLNAVGEVAIYDAFGKSIWLKGAGAGIVVEANNEPITVNNANGITINAKADVTLNMDGKNVIINNPGTVELAGAGGKKVALDGDPVVAGKVQASSTKVTAA